MNRIGIGIWIGKEIEVKQLGIGVTNRTDLQIKTREPWHQGLTIGSRVWVSPPTAITTQAMRFSNSEDVMILREQPDGSWLRSTATSSAINRHHAAVNAALIINHHEPIMNHHQTIDHPSKRHDPESVAARMTLQQHWRKTRGKMPWKIINA